LAVVSWAVDRQKPAHQLLLHILSALSFMTKFPPFLPSKTQPVEHLRIQLAELEAMLAGHWGRGTVSDRVGHHPLLDGNEACFEEDLSIHGIQSVMVFVHAEGSVA
jgi:hypothetical protein